MIETDHLTQIKKIFNIWTNSNVISEPISKESNDTDVKTKQLWMFNHLIYLQKKKKWKKDLKSTSKQAKSIAERHLGVSLKFKFFVFLGAASCVLWLGLPLFLLFGNKGKKDLIEVDSFKYLYTSRKTKNVRISSLQDGFSCDKGP